MYQEIQELIEKEIEAIRNIPVDGSISAAVDLIYEQVHQKKGKVIISGMGKAGQIGLNIATTLSSTGTPAVFLHPAEAQHGDLGIVCSGDVLFLISNSGKTREILELDHLVKNLCSDVRVICLTGNSEAEIGKISEVALYTGHPREICPLGLTPTTSTTVMTVVGDLLVVLLMKKIKFTKADYARRHHSGYLGYKARLNE